MFDEEIIPCAVSKLVKDKENSAMNVVPELISKDECNRAQTDLADLPEAVWFKLCIPLVSSSFA
ncbi:MAG: hypothetical protein N4A65_15565 [Cohaesibacter sp.]|nr:hypothetical protein [Cohaesibacter sp.]